MIEQNPNIAIPMPAIYLLACAQRDRREYLFSPYIYHISQGLLFGPYSLDGFKPGAALFGQPEFTQPQNAAAYIASVAKSRRKNKWMAEAVVSMLTELRYVMGLLAQSPILVDTGHMVPKYQLRSVQDQQNFIANSLTQQPPFRARVKTLHGEFTVRLKPPPELMPEEQLTERIRHIKQRMRERGVTRTAAEVTEEIRKRHEQLRERPPDPPPPTHTNRRRFRPRPPTDA